MGGSAKKPFGEKKIPTSFSIKRKINYAFRERCMELELSPNDVVEQFLKSFLKN